ncbi:hypothetical protein EV421DRAFT_2000983 [Armillaria borealis]|uniref:Uncharacterized protein n=1 Tax=Armillaria borealis TaxID=47425 RepID=A0AA39J0V4_9AGAR|nr:hypothetical protein EV421DRAFT_2000983 [Armillaria borealis]
MSREERSPPPTDTTTRQTTATSSRTHDTSSSSRRRAPSPQQQPEASTSTGITRTRRREQPDPEQPDQERMSKRLRRSSVGSSSEGDTEKNPTPPPPTQKKKRTRTLTDPPTSLLFCMLSWPSHDSLRTAMREEVGRSIRAECEEGSSEYGFKTNAKKRRRPRSQSDIPLTRPPQYGPFPTSSHPLPAFFPLALRLSSGTAPPPPPPYFEPSSSSLLGPGMPGRSFPPPQQSPFRYSRLQEPYPPVSPSSIPLPAGSTTHAHSRPYPSQARARARPSAVAARTPSRSPGSYSPAHFRGGSIPAPLPPAQHVSPQPVPRAYPPPARAMGASDGAPPRFGDGDVGSSEFREWDGAVDCTREAVSYSLAEPPLLLLRACSRVSGSETLGKIRSRPWYHRPRRANNRLQKKTSHD